jgi:hypothetical protein
LTFSVSKTIEDSRDLSRKYRVEHRIGDINFLIEGNCTFSYLTTRRFIPYVIENQKPDIHYEVHVIKKEDCTMPGLGPEAKKALSGFIQNEDTLQDPIFHNQLVREKIDLYFSNLEEITIQIINNKQLAVIFYDFQNLTSDLYLVSDEGNLPVDFGVLFYSIFLRLLSSSMIHCAGVSRNGRAALLLASDGGGKTTTALKAPNHIIISDDRLIIRERNGTIMAYGTPWSRYSDTKSAKVSGFFLLTKSDHFALTPVKSLEVMEYLCVEHQHTRMLLPRKYSLKALDFLWKACTEVPCYKMDVPLDHVDWDAIDKIMGI